MNYQNALDYIYNSLPMYHRIGSPAYKADMGNIFVLLEKLGNPHHNFKSIHIAGTNGKGSVSHLLASVLQEAGLKTALYTSPHLKDFRERIKINGKKIPISKVIDFIKENRTLLDSVKPSFFEMSVAMAFLFFTQQNIDIAVIETGLGGRLDSTNIITPQLSVITNISFDHQHLLGYTLQEIAMEKAGIIKNSIPVIIGETQADTNLVFEHKAKVTNSELSFADQLFKIDNYENNFPENTNASFKIKDNTTNKIYRINCPLLALYQKKNVITAFCAIRKLIDLGFIINELQIENGFKKVLLNTKLMGRWQLLNRKPLTICDTAHNVAGIKMITEQIKTIKYKKLHFIFGCVDDKDVNEVLALLPLNAQYYFCTPNIPRGLDAGKLLKYARKLKLKGNSYASVKDAYQCALNYAEPKDMVFIGGSTFVVAEIV